MTYVIFALLLFDVFLGQLFPGIIGYGAFGTGCFLLFLWAVVSPSAKHMRIDKLWVAWIVLAAFALFSHIITAGFETVAVFIFAVSTGLTLFGTAVTGWIKPASIVTLLYSLIHVVATLAFYLRPSLYEQLVAGRLFVDDRMAVDYTSALTSHYSFNAMYCVFALIISAAWAMAAVKKRPRFTLALIAVLSLFALVLTTKRAHMLFAVLAICAGIASSNMRGRFFKLTMSAIVVLGGVFLGARMSPGIAASLDRLTGSLDTRDLSEITSGRTQLWDYAFAGWSEHPLVGNGWATYKYIWPGGTSESLHAHNTLINGLYEGGILGTLLVLTACTLSLLAALKLSARATGNRNLPSEIRFAAYFSVMIQIFFLTYSFTTGELLRSAYTFVPYLMSIGVILSLRNVPGVVPPLGNGAGSTAIPNATRSLAT